jgi:Zn-dependent protease
METNKENILQEIIEFAVSVIWLGIAFGIAIAGGMSAFSNLEGLRTIIVQSLVVVFFAFVFHELAHRVAARRYGFKAVYHVWIPGLVLAMAASLIGFLFAAPGGVHIQMGQDTVENRAKLGKSALAGPVTNMILAVLFAVLTFTLIYFVDSYISSTGKSITQIESLVNTVGGIGIIGVEINAWLALFNLLPFGNFDGYKVFQWNKRVWTIAFIGSIGLYALMYWTQSALLG